MLWVSGNEYLITKLHVIWNIMEARFLYLAASHKICSLLRSLFAGPRFSPHVHGEKTSDPRTGCVGDYKICRLHFQSRENGHECHVFSSSCPYFVHYSLYCILKNISLIIFLFLNIKSFSGHYIFHIFWIHVPLLVLLLA